MSAELGGQYSDVLAAGDVALYGGLTALASCDRAELKRSIVESTAFRELLELNTDVRAGPCRSPTSLQECKRAWHAAASRDGSALGMSRGAWMPCTVSH